MIDPFTCGLCGKVFSRTQARASHETRVHASERGSPGLPRRSRYYIVLPAEVPPEQRADLARTQAMKRWGNGVIVDVAEHRIHDWSIAIAIVEVVVKPENPDVGAIRSYSEWMPTLASGSY